MRFSRLCVCASFAILGFTKAAFALAISGAGGFIGSDSGGAFDEALFPHTGKTITCSVPSCQVFEESPISVMFPHNEAEVDGQATWGSAAVSAETSAEARAGDLGLKVHTIAVASADRSFGKVGAQANAYWKDTVQVNTGKLAIGDLVIVDSFLTLEGDLGVSADAFAAAEARLSILDLSSSPVLPPAPYGTFTWGHFFEAPGAGIHVAQPMPGAIRLRNFFRNGFGSDLGFSMILTAGSFSDGSGGGRPGSSIVLATVSRSLHWGGIEMVSDQNGNPIDDWTITSESGFDYSKPFGVPEPSCLLLVASALFARLAVRRGRR
jgi:hypothetical protein